MTLAEFFSCSLLAFGAPLIMTVMTIVYDPIRIIIMLVAAFGWLLAFFLSSFIWFAVEPLRSDLAYGMVFAVILQETFRYGIYLLLKKAEARLKEAVDYRSSSVGSKTDMAYVSGLGFGMMSGAFAISNVLADSIGPGSLGLRGGSEFFFSTSAGMALCMILLNTFWSIIFNSGLDEKNYMKVVWVITSHFLVSGLSLLNRNEMYAATILPTFAILCMTMMLAFKSAGGTSKSFVQSFYLTMKSFQIEFKH